MLKGFRLERMMLNAPTARWRNALNPFHPVVSGSPDIAPVYTFRCANHGTSYPKMLRNCYLESQLTEKEDWRGNGDRKLGFVSRRHMMRLPYISRAHMLVTTTGSVYFFKFLGIWDVCC